MASNQHSMPSGDLRQELAGIVWEQPIALTYAEQQREH
jgi:hypothetical protein